MRTLRVLFWAFVVSAAVQFANWERLAAKFQTDTLSNSLAFFVGGLMGIPIITIAVYGCYRLWRRFKTQAIPE